VDSSHQEADKGVAPGHHQQSSGEQFGKQFCLCDWLQLLAAATYQQSSSEQQLQQPPKYSCQPCQYALQLDLLLTADTLMRKQLRLLPNFAAL
jgi:hypothetical protein